MPKYLYRAKDENGKNVSDQINAASKEAVVDQLQRKGYFIISVELIRKSPGSSAKKVVKSQYSHTGVKLDDILIFTRQLATMLEAGVTLIKSLDVIMTQVESRKLGEALREVHADVEGGKTLSDSLAKHPKIFSQFWVSLVEVGEASGTMPKILEKLAQYLEQQAAFRSTIISAIVYPAILFCVCIGAVAFFALFVGPKFKEIFDSMDADLPGITVTLLAIFEFIGNQFLFIIISVIGAVIAFKSYIKTKPGRLMFEKFMYSLPTFGSVYKLIVVEKFSSQLSILIDSGVPILYSLEITEKLVENLICGQVINDIRTEVREGKLLAEPMAESGFFPAMAVQMIKVGEETGELSKMLKHVSAFYQRNVEAFMKRFGTMIEPFMLVFMGFIIGTIVLAMFLPMFNISQLG